jgi:acetyltransferase-like isoleucine patch superfamily enzyme
MLHSPWKLRNHGRRLISLPFVRAEFLLNGIPWGSDWRIFGTPIIQRHAGSTILLGDGLELRSTPRSNPLSPVHPVVLATRSKDATLQIGESCGLTGAAIVAAERIRIGARVLIGANATIVDTDFHPLSPATRRVNPLAGASSPIEIEDDVFIGTRALVLKGVRIGCGAVVGAGSVVTRDVDAGDIVAGNPARKVGHVPTT